MSSPFTVFRFSFWHLSDASPVTKLMNSDAHSCILSLASFEILALGADVTSENVIEVMIVNVCKDLLPEASQSQVHDEAEQRQINVDVEMANWLCKLMFKIYQNSWKVMK
nr:uncharacterized protein A4U43_UnF9640 [Ipomoea trifida]